MIRDAIRSPSFDLLRKNSGVLILNGQGTEKDSMEETYKKFLKDFETLDNKCGIAVRGKKDVPIRDLYKSAAKELLIFADTAEKVGGLNSNSQDTVEKAAEVVAE